MSKKWRDIFGSLFIDVNTAAFFDSIGIEFIPQEVLKKVKGYHSYI